MVKTVKFLALSLLVPSLAFAMMPTQRDGFHAAAGVIAGLGRNNAVEAKGFDTTKDFGKAAHGYLVGDCFASAFFHRVHENFSGPWINNAIGQADTSVSTRDEVAFTAGQILANYWATKDLSTKTFTSAIDPFLVLAAVKYVAQNSSSLLQAGQNQANALQAAEQAYVAAQNSSN